VCFGIGNRNEGSDKRALSLLPQNNLLFAIHVD
jgi:hypothetical protein